MRCLVEIDEEGNGKCQECGLVTILDSTMKICFDCWSLLDLEAAELEISEEE